MSKSLSFNVAVAEKVGVNAAVMLGIIKQSCEWVRANDAPTLDDGLYWFPCPLSTWMDTLPYLGKSAIYTAIDKLEDAGYVRVGDYNDNVFDRTKWYAITELGLSAMEE